MKLGELSALLGVELQGDPQAECLGIRDPAEAGPGVLVFVD